MAENISAFLYAATARSWAFALPPPAQPGKLLRQPGNAFSDHFWDNGIGQVLAVFFAGKRRGLT